MSLTRYIKLDIGRLEDELELCDKTQDNDLIIYLISRLHTLKEILTLIQKDKK